MLIYKKLNWIIPRDIWYRKCFNIFTQLSTGNEIL